MFTICTTVSLSFYSSFLLLERTRRVDLLTPKQPCIRVTGHAAEPSLGISFHSYQVRTRQHVVANAHIASISSGLLQLQSLLRLRSTLICVHRVKRFPRRGCSRFHWVYWLSRLSQLRGTIHNSWHSISGNRHHPCLDRSSGSQVSQRKVDINEDQWNRRGVSRIRRDASVDGAWKRGVVGVAVGWWSIGRSICYAVRNVLCDWKALPAKISSSCSCLLCSPVRNAFHFPPRPCRRISNNIRDLGSFTCRLVCSFLPERLLNFCGIRSLVSDPKSDGGLRGRRLSVSRNTGCHSKRCRSVTGEPNVSPPSRRVDGHARCLPRSTSLS